MTLVKPRTPSGFGEYLPGEQLEFNRLMDIIRATYELHGFSPIDTPDIELSEVLLAKGGGETEQQVYRFDHGRNDLSLRFDLTVPLARYTAQHESALTFPFRRYHIGKVHRGERTQAGRFREFYQCDIDIIGSNSAIVDAEFPAIINEIFEQFNFGEFTIRLNDRRVLNGFFEGIGLKEQSANVLRIIDKMEKISREDVVAELSELGLSNEQIDQVIDFTAIAGNNDEILGKLSGLNIQSELFEEGVSKLTALIQALRVMGVPESRFKIDLKIARGLDYYTGTVYETILDDHPEVGSVCSGGRYDDLASYYTNTELPGVGISIGLTRLFYKLREIGVITPTQQSPVDVVVMPIDQDQTQYALSVAKTLRDAGIGVMLYTESNAVKKKMRYADRMGFRYVVLIGEREVEAESVSLKDMDSGSNETVSVADLAQSIRP